MWQTVNYDRKDIIDKLIESDNIALERESLTNQLKILKGAQRIIKKDPHLSKLQNQATSEDKNERFEQKAEVQKQQTTENKTYQPQTQETQEKHDDKSHMNVKARDTMESKAINKPKLVLFKRDNNKEE